MPEGRIVRSLGVQSPGRLSYAEAYTEGPLGDGMFALETLYSGFSAGTELTFVKGLNPYLHARWEPEFGVFVEGSAGMSYPVPFLGYMESARVVESRTGAAAVGDVIGIAYGHKSGHEVYPPNESFAKLPAGLGPMLGVYVGQMGPICVNGVLHADAELADGRVNRLGGGVAGRRLLVIGAGVVGLLCALLARRAGAAEVVVADDSAFRRGKAQALGFEAVSEAESWELCKTRWSHGGSGVVDRGADAVLQCRASSASLHTALKALRPQGSVIDLAFYTSGASDLRLGEEFHHNGLSIRCAQIGRVPRGLGFAWDRRRLMDETVALLRAEGEAIRRELVTDVVPIAEAPAFVERLASERRDFLQIVFDYA